MLLPDARSESNRIGDHPIIALFAMIIPTIRARWYVSWIFWKARKRDRRGSRGCGGCARRSGDGGTHLVLIEPDRDAASAHGEIWRFEQRGLAVRAAKLVHVDEGLAGEHYAEHREKRSSASWSIHHLVADARARPRALIRVLVVRTTMGDRRSDSAQGDV